MTYSRIELNIILSEMDKDFAAKGLRSIDKTETRILKARAQNLFFGGYEVEARALRQYISTNRTH